MSQRSRLYVGNLPPDVREKDLEDVFRKYGKIDHLDLRTNKGPPFAFLDFTDPRDAEDAIKGRDGYDFDGYRMRVEYPRSYRDTSGGFSRGVGGGRFDGGGGGYSRGGDRGGFSRNRFDSTMRRSQYRVVVTGLPPSGSWQDLKDHMREAGDVCYADVNKDGTGHVEFLRKEDMEYAVKKLDDTKFRSHEGETAYVRVKAEGSSGGGSRRSRSPRSKSRSRSGSKKRSRSRSPLERRAASEENGETKRERSASASPRRSRSKSASKSRSPTHSRSASAERE